MVRSVRLWLEPGYFHPEVISVVMVRDPQVGAQSKSLFQNFIFIIDPNMVRNPDNKSLQAD